MGEKGTRKLQCLEERLALGVESLTRVAEACEGVCDMSRQKVG